MLLRFNGTDLVGMVFALLSALYLARERRIGFIFAMIAGAGWVMFGFITGSIPSMIANSILILCNAAGYFRWKAKHKD